MEMHCNALQNVRKGITKKETHTADLQEEDRTQWLLITARKPTLRLKPVTRPDCG